MSDLTSTVFASPAAGAPQESHPTATGPVDVEENLSKITIQAPVSLPMLPPEMTLNILRYLERSDWAAYARTCRRVSNVVSAELEKRCMGKDRDRSLWYACVTDKPDLLRRHISHDATIVNHTFSYYPGTFRGSTFGLGMSALAAAVTAGRENIVRLLLENNANANLPDDKPMLMGAGHYYPINRAVRSKHKSSVAIISMLKQHSANMNQVPKDEGDGVVIDDYHFKRLKYAPIFQVLRLDMPVGNSRLSAQPTSCEQFNRDFRKRQALRSHQLVALLSCGADPNAIGNFMTPIFFLLDSLARYVPSFYFSNRLILSDEADKQASLVNNFALLLLDVLLAYGADIHAFGNTEFYKDMMGDHMSDEYVESPLHAVCRLRDRHRPLIDWFLYHGVDVNIRNANGVTTLMVYCSSPFEDLEQFQQFLNRRPEIDLRDRYRQTALHHLCTNDRLKIQVKEKAVRMMLDAGADPTALDESGHHPMWRDNKNKKNYPPDVHDSLRETLDHERNEWEKRKKKNGNHPKRANRRCGERGDHEGRGPGKKENRDGNPECERPGRRPENCTNVRGGDRGKRGSYRGRSQAGHHSGTQSNIQNGSGNTGDDDTDGKQNLSYDETRRHASQEQNRPALQGSSNQNVRGGCQRDGNRGAIRGNKRGRGGAR
ncbi:hypothetical protein F4678DRAFT_419361 [Xylaria arbuscula]|nr:hypothetical protein F4678DRAFT_419361 [Xylaria arbuscula]